MQREIIYQQSQLSRKIPVDSKLTNVTAIYKKGQKKDSGNYMPVSPTSVPEKVMEQIILNTTHRTTRLSGLVGQHVFIKGRSCLTNLISFYDKVTRLVDKGKPVNVVYLDISKAFDTVTHSILLEKLTAHGLDSPTLCSDKNRLDGQTQRVVVNGVQYS